MVTTDKTCDGERVKALAENTIAECRQQGFTIREIEEFLTRIQGALVRREEELRKELF